MIYILLTQQTTLDGTHQILPVSQFDNINDAESAFHSQLASAMVSDALVAFTATVLDSFGNVIYNRAWQKAISSPAE